MSNIHLCHNLNLHNSEKYSKMRAHFYILNHKFRDHAPPEESHGVDKSMNA